MAQAAVSKQDRATFRDRLKAAIKSAGTSGKKLEKAIGVRSGTLSKIYGGKKALTADTLTAMANELGHEAADLVTGTGWECLLVADDDYASRETELGAYDRALGPHGATTPEPTPAVPQSPATDAAPEVPPEVTPASPNEAVKEKPGSKGILGSLFGGLFGRE